MRRLRIPWRWALFAGAFLFSLVALLPLRVALDALDAGERGLAAEEAVGSVWFGGLTRARLGPVPLGDVSARLRFLPLLVGQARLDLRSADEGGLRGGLSLARHGFGISDANGHASVPAAGDMPPLDLDLDDVSISFRDGLCARADGLVRARFTGGFAGAPLAAGLSAEPRCEGPALLLPLAGQAGRERVELRLYGDGRYRADLSLGPAGAPAATRLQGRF